MTISSLNCGINSAIQLTYRKLWLRKMDEGIARVFQKEQARTSLNTRVIGRKLYAYDLVTSTNDLAHYLAKGGETQGAVIFARGQTQGRGRMGRKWVSAYGEGLYFSCILHPPNSKELLPCLTLTIALGVVRGLEGMDIEGLSIKWPNDILIDGKKVCGILSEIDYRPDGTPYIITGVGINVNTSETDLPCEATSLKAVMDKELDIADLSHVIIQRMDDYYELLLNDKFSTIINEVKEFSGLVLGGRVRVVSGSRMIEGYAVDFDEVGSLILRCDNGLFERVTSGHLTRLE